MIFIFILHKHFVSYGIMFLMFNNHIRIQFTREICRNQ